MNDDHLKALAMRLKSVISVDLPLVEVKKIDRIVKLYPSEFLQSNATPALNIKRLERLKSYVDKSQELGSEFALYSEEPFISTHIGVHLQIHGKKLYKTERRLRYDEIIQSLHDLSDALVDCISILDKVKKKGPKGEPDLREHFIRPLMDVFERMTGTTPARVWDNIEGMEKGRFLEFVMVISDHYKINVTRESVSHYFRLELDSKSF